MFADEPADKPAEKNSDPFGFLSTGTSRKKKKSSGLFDFGSFGFDSESSSSEPEVVAKSYTTSNNRSSRVAKKTS